MENTKEKGDVFMRFYNIYYICKSCVDVIEDVNVLDVRNGNNVVVSYRIKNWMKCRKILPELRKIKCLEEKIDAFCSTLNFIAIEQDTPEVTVDIGRKFKMEFEKFRTSLETIIAIYESMGLGCSSYGIDVKIPQCDSLKEYMDYLKEIDFIFSQCPYLQHKDDQIKFKNVDVGSQWLAFIVGTAGGFYILNNLAKLVERAIAMKSYFITIRQQEEMLRTMQLKNEATEESIETFKAMKRMTMDGYIKDVESEMGELKDGEERGKVEKSLEKMSSLIDKGVEIYSSIEAPNEIKALFPMSENNVLLPDNLVKLLESKADGATE